MVRQTKNATATTDYALGIPWKTLPMYLSNATLVQARAWAFSELFGRDNEIRMKISVGVNITKFKDGKVSGFVGQVSDFDYESMSALWTDFKTGDSYRINCAGAKIKPKKSKKNVPIIKRELDI